MKFLWIIGVMIADFVHVSFLDSVTYLAANVAFEKNYLKQLPITVKILLPFLTMKPDNRDMVVVFAELFIII